MGVTIMCKKTGRQMDMGYFAFDRLRTKVAELADPDIGARYRKLNDILRLSGPERGKAERLYDDETAALIASGKLNPKIGKFLYQSDESGSIRYGACMEILKAIGDYDSDEIFGYAGRSDAGKFSDFKAILQDCVNSRCSLVWL